MSSLVRSAYNPYLRSFGTGDNVGDIGGYINGTPGGRPVDLNTPAGETFAAQQQQSGTAPGVPSRTALPGARPGLPLWNPANPLTNISDPSGQPPSQAQVAQNQSDASKLGDSGSDAIAGSLAFGDGQSYITGGPVSSLQQAAYNRLKGGVDQSFYQLDPGGNLAQARQDLYGQALGSKYDIQGANQARGDQQNSLNLLASAAQGQGPSQAGATLNRSLGSINNQLRAAAFAQQGNRGAGLTQRNLLNAQTAAANNAQSAAGVAAAGEQTAARGQYTTAANNLRASDVGAAQAAQQGDLYRIGAASGQQDALGNLAVGQLNANIAYQGQQQNNALAQSALLQQDATANGTSDASLLGKVFDTGAAAAKYYNNKSDTTKSLSLSSDVNTKYVTGGAEESDKDLDGFLKKINPQAYGAAVAASGSSSSDDTLGKLIGYGAQAAATYYSNSSDRATKRDITPSSVGDAKTSKFLDGLQAYEYRYKDPAKDGEGPRLGIMAQDAQKSDMGRGMVTGTEGQLRVDIPKAVSATLASVAHLNKRLDALEGRRNA